jgi:hypothetical protein
MKTEQTKALELGIWNYTNKQGVFGCFEVTIGWFGNERVDYITYDTNGVWRCYEIKISKSDFHSKNHNTFIGDFNYYIMPYDLYEQVKDEIPIGIGVYTPSENGIRGYPELTSQRKAKRQELKVDEQVMKDSMIRSLCREVNKQMQEGNEFRMGIVQREANRLEKTNRDLERRLRDANQEIYYMKHPDRTSHVFAR